MTADLKTLIDENTECEYKEKESEGLYKTISAFSNTNGGCIVRFNRSFKNSKQKRHY